MSSAEARQAACTTRRFSVRWVSVRSAPLCRGTGNCVVAPSLRKTPVPAKATFI